MRPPNEMMQRAMTRLGCDFETALAIASRDLPTCDRIVAESKQAWDDHVAEGGCDKCTPDENGNAVSCDTLMRLWNANNYRSLAFCHAPVSGAHVCDCNGTGRFYGHGYVENGVFKGNSGVCYRCGGKGWQSDADRTRNRFYDNHVRRVHV
jgi:hypothetical protein